MFPSLADFLSLALKTVVIIAQHADFFVSHLLRILMPASFIRARNWATAMPGSNDPAPVSALKTAEFRAGAAYPGGIAACPGDQPRAIGNTAFMDVSRPRAPAWP
jgi:hypothetical protein